MSLDSLGVYSSSILLWDLKWFFSYFFKSFSINIYLWDELFVNSYTTFEVCFNLSSFLRMTHFIFGANWISFTSSFGFKTSIIFGSSFSGSTLDERATILYLFVIKNRRGPPYLPNFIFSIFSSSSFKKLLRSRGTSQLYCRSIESNIFREYWFSPSIFFTIAT